MDMSLSKLQEMGERQGSLACCSPWDCRVGHDWVTELNWSELTLICSWEVRDCTRSLDSKSETGSEITGLFFKTTGISDPGMAKLSVGSSSHSPVGYDAFKITLGQHLDVLTPHQVQSVLEVKGHHWLTGGGLKWYQAFLMDIPDIKVVPNPEPRNSASRSLE